MSIEQRYFENPEPIEHNAEKVDELVDLIVERLPVQFPPDTLSEFSLKRQITEHKDIVISSYYCEAEAGGRVYDNCLFYSVEINSELMDDLEENTLYESTLVYEINTNFKTGEFNVAHEQYYDEHGEPKDVSGSTIGEGPMTMLHLVDLKRELNEMPIYYDIQGLSK